MSADSYPLHPLYGAFGVTLPRSALSLSQAPWPDLDELAEDVAIASGPCADNTTDGDAPLVIEAPCWRTADAAAILGVRRQDLSNKTSAYRSRIRHGRDSAGRLWWVAADVARVAEARQGGAR